MIKTKCRNTREEPFGLINVNKPCGMTSRRAVDRVLSLVRPAKAGHAGTLDPLASGVLVVCVGPATRLIEYVQQMTKHYTATFLLGRESDTEDVEGEVTLLESPPQPTLEAVHDVAADFVGHVEQRPPAFSAIKVGGRRAYKLARAGDQVKLAPRTIRIDTIDVVRYEYPELVLDVVCGSGTYIRSLGRDLAQRLGTGAVMSALVRTAIGRFRVEESCDLDELTEENLLEHLQPARLAVETLPVVDLTDEQIRRVGSGMAIEASISTEAEEFAGVDSSGRLVAILIEAGGGRLRPVRNFPRPE